MRVAVDFKVVSTEAALRGMGRYTQQQIREVLIHDPSVEIFLLMHGPVPKENVLFDWSAFPNVHCIPVSVDGHVLDYRQSPSFETILAYSHRIQQLLKELKIDVFHNTVPFMHPYYSAVTVCPVVSTFYDAIPLIFPSYYFAPPYGSHVLRLHYLRSLENVAASDRVLAISQSAGKDLRLYTGYCASRTHIAYPLVEKTFRPLAPDSQETEENIQDLDHGKVVFRRLPEQFILSVTGIHHSKNVSLLVDGFLTAARELPEENGLVIVLPSAFAQSEFQRRFGSHPRITTVADISEEELALLYNKAHMVVQTSMYEGFGYPVAEAMSCGAAVIATSTSSIPEITGSAAVLVPPTDPRVLATAIVWLCRDPEIRKTLRRRALKRSVLFQDPRALATATLDAYRSAVRSGSSSQEFHAARGSRVAVWSSMPPKDCGVADYTYELVHQLAETHDVDLYVDGKYEPTPPLSRRIKFRHPHDYGIDIKPVKTIFQVGARKDYQDYMYPYILKHGGTMVIHDISMAQAFYYIAKWGGLMNQFEDEVVLPEGLDVLDAYTRLEANCTTPPHDVLHSFFKQHKMLKWLIDHSDRLVVHTDPLRKRLLEDYPTANVGVVRMGVNDKTQIMRHLPCASLRAALGLTDSGLCVGSFGIMDRVKRIELVIDSFVHLCRSYPKSLLLLVGSCYDSAYRRELKTQISKCGFANRILMLDYVPVAAFHALMALTDVVVNLRSPDRLGLSAVLLRALAAAKPVITSRIEEWQIFPEGSCLWISSGANEMEQLTGHFIRLARSRSDRTQLGLAARRWFLANATVRLMADDYMAPVHYMSSLTLGQP